MLVLGLQTCPLPAWCDAPPTGNGVCTPCSTISLRAPNPTAPLRSRRHSLTHSSRFCSVTPGLRHTSLKVPSSASLIDARIALTYMTPSLAPALLLLLTLVVLVTRSSISWFRSSMSAGNPVETRHIAGAWRPRFPSAPRAPRLHDA